MRDATRGQNCHAAVVGTDPDSRKRGTANVVYVDVRGVGEVAVASTASPLVASV